MNILSLWHLVNLEILTTLNRAICLFLTNYILQALLEKLHREVQKAENNCEITIIYIELCPWFMAQGSQNCNFLSYKSVFSFSEVMLGGLLDGFWLKAGQQKDQGMIRSVKRTT